MMQIRIIAVGKARESWQKEGIADFIRRLSPYATVSMTDVADQPSASSPGERRKAIAREGEALLAAAGKKPGLVLALDPSGTGMTSEAFAGFLQRSMIEGSSTLTFLIGGADGLSEEIRSRSDHLLSLSQMTFTHTMVRLFLLEQIYRGFRIIRGEPYHR